MKEMRLISATGCDCPICVCVFVLGSTDISSNVADISRGFEDLIPSVFEELCAAALQRSLQGLRPSVHSRAALYTASLLALLLSLAVFP